MSNFARLIGDVRKGFSALAVAFFVVFLVLGILVPALTSADQEVRLLTAQPVEFDRTRVGEESSKTVTFRNDSREEVTVVLQRRTNPYFNTSTPEFKLDAHKAKTISILFTPNNTGEFRGELTFGVVDSDQRIEVRANGTGFQDDEQPSSGLFQTGPFVALDQTVDFGAVELREYREATVLVQNQAADLISVDLNLSANGRHFRVPSRVSVAPGSVQAVKVRFNPVRVGKQTALLTMTSGEFQQVVRLNGRGLAVTGFQPSVNFVSDLQIANHAPSKAIFAPNETVDLTYELSHPARVTVSVQKGDEVVRTLQNYGSELLPARTYKIGWDGKDTQGKQVANGKYRYVIDAYSEDYGSALAYGFVNVGPTANGVPTPFGTVVNTGRLELQDTSAGAEWRVVVSKPATVAIALKEGAEVVEVVDRFYALPGSVYVRGTGLASELENGIYTYELTAVADNETRVARGSLVKGEDGVFVSTVVPVPVETSRDDEQLLNNLQVTPVFFESNTGQIVEGSFDLREKSHVRAEVFNTRTGRSVRTLMEAKTMNPGRYNDVFSWGGVDRTNKKVGAGSYVIKVTANSVKGKKADIDSTFVFVDSLPFHQTGVTRDLTTGVHAVPSSFGYGGYSQVKFTLDEKAKVRAYVRDSNGDYVTPIFPQTKEFNAGENRLSWSGKDYYSTEFVEPGTYEIVITTTGIKSKRKDVDKVRVGFGVNVSSANRSGLVAQVNGQTNVRPEVALDHKLTREEAVALLNTFDLDAALFNPATDVTSKFNDLDFASEKWLLSPFKSFLKTAWVTRTGSDGVVIKEMLSGYPRAEVLLPKQRVTQAEFYKLFVEGLMNQEQGTSLQIDRNPKQFCLRDVEASKQTNWYLPYAQFVCNELIGTEAGDYHRGAQFRAGADVTVEQALSVLRVGRDKGWW